MVIIQCPRCQYQWEVREGVKPKVCPHCAKRLDRNPNNKSDFEYRSYTIVSEKKEEPIKI